MMNNAIFWSGSGLYACHFVISIWLMAVSIVR